MALSLNLSFKNPTASCFDKAKEQNGEPDGHQPLDYVRIEIVLGDRAASF